MANKTLSGAEVIIECLKREGVDTISDIPVDLRSPCSTQFSILILRWC